MDKRLIAAGIVTGIFHIYIANMIKTTEMIWVETRLLGIIAYFALFITLVLGEIRMLHKTKGEFGFFKYHKPIAIFTIYLVLLHFTSSIFEKFKWGTNLNIFDYLGFNYSDKWMAALSLGALALYLLLLVGITSSTKNIQIIGFKRWKLMHYAAYPSFLFAYIHSINLGTDLKTGTFSYMLMPIFLFTFLFIISLFLTRIFSTLNVLSDQTEITLATIMFLLLVFKGAFILQEIAEKQDTLDTIEDQSSQNAQELIAIEKYNQNILNETNEIISKIAVKT